jgi:hypothetical protein
VILDRPDGPALPHRNAAAAGSIAVALGYAWVAGHFTTFSRPAEVVTFIPGLLAMIVAVRSGPRQSVRPDRRGAGWLGWWLIVIALNAVELVSLALGSTSAHPTISDLVNPWLLSTPARAVAFALWLGLGYWLSRR